MHTHRPIAFATALVLASAAAAAGQDIEQQVRRVGNGQLRLAFAARPGTCGDGATFISTRGVDEEGNFSTFRHSRTGWNTSTRSGHDEHRSCEEGPVWVNLAIERGTVTEVETFVGSQVPQPALSVSTRAAVDYLLTLAENSPARVGKRAILPAILADSVEPWARLLGIAKNDNAVREVRKTSIFWLGQAAGDKAADGLKSLLSDHDLEIKKQAVFAISQHRGDQSVTALVEIVRTNRDPEVRKSALFWLGQKNDPRVIALLEEILLK